MIIVTCKCGLSYTLEQFRTLPLTKVLPATQEKLEIRPCVCGKHHSILIDRNGHYQRSYS